MPIYEFYCSRCHRIFNFYSATVNTQKRPLCPRCGRIKLTRQMSIFATVGRAEEEDALPPVNEQALERAISTLARDEAALEGDDPRAAAEAMCEIYRAGGLKMGVGTQEYLRRLAGGEDPDALEDELGHLLEEEDPFSPGAQTPHGRRFKPPTKDEKLYEL